MLASRLLELLSSLSLSESDLLHIVLEDVIKLPILAY